MKFYLKLALTSVLLGSLSVLGMEKATQHVPSIDLLKKEDPAIIRKKVKQIKTMGLTIKDVLQQQCDQECDERFEKVIQILALNMQELGEFHEYEE